MTVIDELKALDLQRSGLHQKAPYVIENIRRSQFSLARLYGSVKIEGMSYTYFPDSDELVRDDVLEYIRKAGKATEKASKEIARLEREKYMALQGDLIGHSPERMEG